MFFVAAGLGNTLLIYNYFETINAEGYALPECILIPDQLYINSW